LRCAVFSRQQAFSTYDTSDIKIADNKDEQNHSHEAYHMYQALFLRRDPFTSSYPFEQYENKPTTVKAGDGEQVEYAEVDAD